MKNKENVYKIIYLLIFASLALLAIWGGYLGTNSIILTQENSVILSPNDFSPSYEARRISENEVGMQTYNLVILEDQLEKLSGDYYKLIVNKPTDNAMRISLNNQVVLSEGNMTNGRSMFKNNYHYCTIDADLFLPRNTLTIETYSLYKTGLETQGLMLVESNAGARLIKILDFFNVKLVLIGFGFLFFSALFTFYIYTISDEKDITLIYCTLATLSLSIYFLDYVKVGELSLDYFFYKKVFLGGLQLGCIFYILAISDFLEAKYYSHQSPSILFSIFILALLQKTWFSLKATTKYGILD